MSITLKIYKNLAATDLLGMAELEDYNPVVGAVDEESATESLTLNFTGGSATIDANLLTLMNLFSQARVYRDTGMGDEVMIELGLDGSNWRADIWDGRIDTGQILGYERANGQRRVTVTWTRDAAWRSDTLTALPLSNGNGNDVTSGLKIYNVNDGMGTSPNKQQNWAAIYAADILGDSLAPVEASLKCVSAATNLADVILTINNHDLLNYGWYEGEDAASGGTPIVDATRSGGKTLQISGISTSAWSTMLGQYVTGLLGAPMKFIMAVYPDTVQGYYFRPFWYDGNIYHSGPTVYKKFTTSNWQLLDLGTMRIPGITPAKDYPAVKPGVQIRAETSSGGVQIDFLQVTYADYVASSMGLQGAITVAQNSHVYFDRWGNAILQPPSSPPANTMRLFGSGLYVQPGLEHLVSLSSCGYIAVTQEHAIRAYELILEYYPRRRVLV